MAIALLAPGIVRLVLVVLLAYIVPAVCVIFCSPGLALAPRRIIDLRLVHLTEVAKVKHTILLLRLVLLLVVALLVPIVLLLAIRRLLRLLLLIAGVPALSIVLLRLLVVAVVAVPALLSIVLLWLLVLVVVPSLSVALWLLLVPVILILSIGVCLLLVAAVRPWLRALSIRLLIPTIVIALVIEALVIEALVIEALVIEALIIEALIIEAFIISFVLVEAIALVVAKAFIGIIASVTESLVARVPVSERPEALGLISVSIVGVLGCTTVASTAKASADSVLREGAFEVSSTESSKTTHLLIHAAHARA